MKHCKAIHEMLPLLQIAAGNSPVRYQEFDFGFQCGISIDPIGGRRAAIRPAEHARVPRTGLAGWMERRTFLRKIGLIRYRYRALSLDEIKLGLLIWVRQQTRGFEGSDTLVGVEP